MKDTASRTFVDWLLPVTSFNAKILPIGGKKLVGFENIKENCIFEESCINHQEGFLCKCIYTICIYSKHRFVWRIRVAFWRKNSSSKANIVRYNI